MDSEAKVRIVGDASSGIAASKEMSAAWEKAGSVMRGAFDRVGASSRENFADVARSADKAADEATRASRRTVDAMARIDGASERMGRTGSTAFSLVKGAALGFIASLGVGTVTRAISEGLEYAASLGEVAQQLGVTTDDLQVYRYAASQVGISQDEMDQGLAKLTRSLGEASLGAKKPIEALGLLGFSLDEIRRLVAGTAGDALPKLADKFASIKSPAQRAAIEVDLFGKAGQKLDTLLAGGSSAIDRLRDAAFRLGYVLSKEQIQNADKTAERLGDVKRILEANIAGAVSNNAQAILQLANSFLAAATRAVQLFQALQNFGALKIVDGTLDTFGSATSKTDRQFAMNSLLGNQSGRDAMVRRFQQNIANEREAMESRTQAAGTWGGALPETAAKRNEASAAFIARQEQAINAVKRLDGALAGSSAYGSRGGIKPSDMLSGTGSGDAGSKSGKGGGVNRTAQWEQELQDQRNAYDKMAAQQENFEGFSKASEAAFWDDILSRHQLTAKERVDVEKRANAARIAAQKETFDSVIEGFRDEMQLAGENAAERVRISKAAFAEIAKHYSQDTREYRSAQREVVQEQKRAADQLAAIEQLRADDVVDASLAAVDAQEDEARSRVELGQQTYRQLLQQELQFEAKRTAIKRHALESELASLRQNPNSDPVALQRLKNQLLEVERQYLARKRQIEIAAETQATLRTRAGIQGVASSWGQALARMATLQASFATTIKGLWQGLAGAISGALASIIEDYIKKWLASLLIKRATGAAGNLAEVVGHAGVAGAGGVASMAAAPFPLNLTAPAFGAAMSAAAMAFAPVASAAGGFDIPAGVNPVTQLHKREMVLPEKLADVVRSMAEGGSGGGGGMAVHIHATDADSVKRLLMNNKGVIADALKSAVRDGKR